MCITVGNVIDSVFKNEYNWLAGKLAGTVKNKKITGRVNFRLTPKKRRVVTVTAVTRILYWRKISFKPSGFSGSTH